MNPEQIQELVEAIESTGGNAWREACLVVLGSVLTIGTTYLFEKKKEKKERKNLNSEIFSHQENIKKVLDVLNEEYSKAIYEGKSADIHIFSTNVQILNELLGSLIRMNIKAGESIEKALKLSSIIRKLEKVVDEGESHFPNQWINRSEGVRFYLTEMNKLLNIEHDFKK